MQLLLEMDGKVGASVSETAGTSGAAGILAGVVNRIKRLSWEYLHPQRRTTEHMELIGFLEQCLDMFALAVQKQLLLLVRVFVRYRWHALTLYVSWYKTLEHTREQNNHEEGGRRG